METVAEKDLFEWLSCPCAYLIKPYAMKTYGGGCIVPLFLTLALDGRGWSTSLVGHFTPRIHWIGGWVVPRTGLDSVEKRKSLASAGNQTLAVQLEARRLTNYAVRIFWIG
jgi:hypothetical protein